MVNLPETTPDAPSPRQQVIEKYQYRCNLLKTRKLTKLTELEEHADMIHRHNVQTNPNGTNTRQQAMNSARQFFKLEFKMVCDACGTVHYQDEITAPER